MTRIKIGAPPPTKPSRKTMPPAPPARFKRGQTVDVVEEGIAPWRGDIGTAKYSRVSGWWYEVANDDGTWILQEKDLREVSA